MPFKSNAQRRKFYAMKSKGEISNKTLKEWEGATKGKLPERVKMGHVLEGFIEEMNKTAQRPGPRPGLGLGQGGGPVARPRTGMNLGACELEGPGFGAGGGRALGGRSDTANLMQRILAMLGKKA